MITLLNNLKINFALCTEILQVFNECIYIHCAFSPKDKYPPIRRFSKTALPLNEPQP